MNNLISVCIATYKRPELLEKLLFSLLNQKSVDEYKFEVIVVDNDVNKTAQPVINKFIDLIKNNLRFSLKYDMQPEKNIALTRNRTIELAEGDYIFFIDDDEYASEYWMYEHLKTLKSFKSDVVFGPVYPYFNKDVPEWITNCSVYLKLTQDTGEKNGSFYTGNCCLKREIFNVFPKPFDPTYGITGGSDHEFFTKVARSGYKMIACKEAIVYEFVPDERANIKWLIKRVFRTGNNYSRTLIFTKDKQSIILSIGQIIKGFLQFIIAFFLSILFIWNKSQSVEWLLISFSNLGKIFAVFRIYPKEYKNK